MMKTLSSCIIALVILIGHLSSFSEDFGDFQSRELQCRIGNNTSIDEHRAGYNGIFCLTSIHQPQTLFVPAYAGLNLEHVFHSALEIENREALFEPRLAPMAFRRVDDRTAELLQPPTPLTKVESYTTFRLRDPYYIDVEFRCVPTQDVFAEGTFGLFWASYINAPHDKSIYFVQGGSSSDRPMWQQFCTQYHNHDSTVVFEQDSFHWNFPPSLSDRSLFSSLSQVKYALPFYYGRVRNMVWIILFADPTGIRFSHSPSGGGRTAKGDDSNPAWDFQFVVPDAAVGKEYSTTFRAVYKLWESRDDVLNEYRCYQEFLTSNSKDAGKE
ncbi:MAG: hypothetical protein C4527_06285 [Candidatus Omnitrophota bacterium]|jgi:hypothetical protein|nr:MAG: hypothetical protein C4527_06285 [Candidatus Omnitrophota bacterium]